MSSSASVSRLPATLEPVRFGEFLRDRNLITEDQWLAALADHWSSGPGKRRRIGSIIVDRGYLALEIVEAEARAFHEELDIVEVDSVLSRSEKTTVPIMPMQVA